MTGKDVIIYILENGLLDKNVFEDGHFMDFLTEEEIAAKFKVGVETIRTWTRLYLIEGVQIGKSTFYLSDTMDPRNRHYE